MYFVLGRDSERPFNYAKKDPGYEHLVHELRRGDFVHVRLVRFTGLGGVEYRPIMDLRKGSEQIVKLGSWWKTSYGKPVAWFLVAGALFTWLGILPLFGKSLQSRIRSSPTAEVVHFDQRGTRWALFILPAWVIAIAIVHEALHVNDRAF